MSRLTYVNFYSGTGSRNPEKRRTKKRKRYRLRNKKALIFAAFILLVLSFNAAVDAPQVQGGNLPAADYSYVKFVVQDFWADVPEVGAEILSNQIYVPLAFLSQNLSMKYEVREDKVSINYNKKTLEFNYGTAEESLAVRLYDRIFVPLKKVCDYYGYEVSLLKNNDFARIKNAQAKLSNDDVFKKYKNDYLKGVAVPSGKTMYLTFDDGPSENTETILSILAEYGYSATFFCHGTQMKKYPELLKKIADEGHAVGLHSMTHIKSKFYESPSAALDEMNQANDILYSILGRKVKITRTPFGSYPYFTSDFRKLFSENDYKVWDWNVESYDSSSAGYSAESIAQKTIAQLKRLKTTNPVILFHNKKVTAEALPKILKYISENGYVCKPVFEDDEAYNFYKNKI